MPKDIAVEFTNVDEGYDIEIILDGKSSRERFLALQDISFSVKKSESVAVIGPNGAGKSTLLRLIAGLLKSDKGKIKVLGRVGSLLDLGAGFHPELTGRDNLLLNASLYNFSRDDMNLRFEQILQFADIGKFIDAPVRCYSQGMYVRLAFSLAIHVDPDILLIDDCLAVGDENFQMKCIDKVLELKEKGVTIFFVTHDMHLAKEVCDRGIYIKNGRILKDTTIDETIAYYTRPFEIDKETYRYLSAKRQREEKRRQEEEAERRQRQQEERRQLEEERQRLEEERRRQEEEAERRQQLLEAAERRWQEAEERRRQEEEERRREEEAAERRRQLEAEKIRQQAERKRQAHTLFYNSALKLIFDSGRVRFYHNDSELTQDFGLHTIFNLADSEYSSSGAMWRIKKISDKERICYLKWHRPLSIFQVWKIKLLDKDELDLEIIMQAHQSQMVQNERIELSLSHQYRLLELNTQNNKSKILSVEGKPAINFASSQERQVCGVYPNREGGPALYFLTIPKRESYAHTAAKSRYTYFQGRIYLGEARSKPESPVIVSYPLKGELLKVDFANGSCCLRWKDKELTKGLGIYTSLCSKGIWYDSTQALWELKEASREKVVVEGFWPWIPLSQVWEITLTKDNTRLWDIEMEIYKKVSLSMQETVMMLSDDYRDWFTPQKSGKFPEEFTSDDLFRYCLWCGNADGVNSIGVRSAGLPVVTFKPTLKEQSRLLIENSSHIYNTKSRLLHCLRVNKNREVYFEPGKYKFFKGQITIVEEDRCARQKS